MRELQQAAAQSTEMANTLTQFQQATTRTEQRGLLDQLLARWADTSGMAQSLEERAAGKYRIVYEACAGDAQSRAGLIPMNDFWPLLRRDLPQLDASSQAAAFWNDDSRGADPFAWSSYISGTSHCPVSGIEPKGMTSLAALPVPRSGTHYLL